MPAPVWWWVSLPTRLPTLRSHDRPPPARPVRCSTCRAPPGQAPPVRHCRGVRSGEGGDLAGQQAPRGHQAPGPAAGSATPPSWPTTSPGLTGTRVSAAPVAARTAATTAGVEEMVGGSPMPLAPKGAPGSGSSTKRRHDLGHVQRGGDEVVGEGRVADQRRRSSTISSMIAKPMPWAMPPSTWPIGGAGVQDPAHVLAGGHLHDAHEAQVGVDVDHGAVGGERERHVGVALAIVVEGVGRRCWYSRTVPPSASSRSSARAGRPRRPRAAPSRPPPGSRRGPGRPSTPGRAATRASNSARTAWHAAWTAPPAIQVWRAAQVDPADPIGGVGRGRSTPTTPARCAGDLLGQGDEPLAHLGRRARTVATAPSRPASSRTRPSSSRRSPRRT